jgi:CheY-like chemotaxis protein
MLEKNKEIKTSADTGPIPDKNKEKNKAIIKILVVDDDPSHRQALLSKLGFEKKQDGFSAKIDEADNLKDALKQLEQNDYHIVMTDGVFPQEAGGFASALYEHDFRGNQIIEAAKSKGVKLVVGISSEPERFQQADLVFKKPLDINTLKEAVKQIAKNNLTEV